MYNVKRLKQVTEFARSSASGALTFADSIRDGELIRASFPAAPLPFPASHEARAGVHFTANAVDYLTVAAGAGPQPQTPNPKPEILTLNPKLETPNPKPKTLDPKP